MRASIPALYGFLLFATIEFASAQVLYVPGAGINNVPAIVDPDTKTITGFLQSGENSYKMAVGPGGSRGYIANLFDRTVEVIDLNSDTRIATLLTASVPYYLVLDNSGAHAYVGLASYVQVVDTSTNAITGEIDPFGPVHSLAVSRTLPRLYIGLPGRVAVVDTTTNSIISSINTIPTNLLAVAMVPSPDDSKLYVLGRDEVNESIGFLMTVDLNLGVVTRSLPLGGYLPWDMAITPDGSRIYISFEGPYNGFTGTLSALDTASGSLIGTVPVFGYAGEMALAPVGRDLYLAVNEALANVVDVIDTTTLTITTRMLMMGGALDLAFAIPPTYEAEAPGNVLTGKARVVPCPNCSGGLAVAGVAEPGFGPTGGSLTFNNVAAAAGPQAKLSIYYQHNERSAVRAAVTVNGVTTILGFPPIPPGTTGFSKVFFTIPGQAIGTITITGVQGTSASSLTIDRVTVQ